ncbi:MAG: carboxypeptidase regulatory-like domain-containing protein [Bryobacteraceae bacterium]
MVNSYSPSFGRFSRGAYLTLFLLVSFSCSVWGQGFGTIVGTVTDQSGAVVAGAKVTVTDPATGQSRDEATNAQGYYVVPSLKPAPYDVSVSASGFGVATQKGVTLLADQTATVNIALALGKTAETVLVTGEPPQVNTTTATMSEVVEQRRVVDLPLNGRNAATLLLVVAGATPAPASDVDQGNTKTFPGAVTVSTNGSRQNQVSYRLDGANNNDLYTNTNQPFPFPDALQEFSVQTSNYGARYGGNAGGVVNVVTKSGTNSLHGDVFEFNRNAVFNARNFFAPTRDQLKRNQFGGTIGGPVYIPKLYNGKDKTFFFFGYQGTRIRNVGNPQSATLPTAAERTGDFSALLNGTNPANPFRRSIQLRDKNGNVLPGNIIPSSLFDPAAINFFKYVPVPTSTNGTTFFSQPIGQNFKEFLTRGDHSFSEHDRLSLRYFYDQFDNQGYIDPKNVLSYQNFTTIISQNALVAETHIFGAGAVNEFRASFSRETSVRGPANGSIGLTDLGVNIYQPSTGKLIEGINVNGYFNPGQTDPASFIRNQYNLSDDFNLVRGRHTISFGGSASRAQVLLRNQFRTSGQYTFTADLTGDGLASFMQGYIRTFTQGFGEFKDNLINTYSLYVQDDFHVSRKLTVNFGLRYDPFFPWMEQKNRIEQFAPENYYKGVKSQVYVNAPPGLLFPGDPGVPRWGATASLNNFSPRLGFAYDLTGDGKTSIRGGAGSFYDAIQSGIANNRTVDLTPFSPQLSLTTPAGTFSNPYIGITNPFPAQFPPPRNAAFPAPVLVVTYDPANGGKQLTPTVYNWNVSLERQLSSTWLLRLAYVGSRSTHLQESVELNPAVYGPGATAGNTDARRAFRNYGSISQASQDINSIYHSAQVTVQKRLSHGVSLLANYTWAKSLDTLPAGMAISTIDQSSYSAIPWSFPGRHQNDYGPSEFDRTHRFILSYVWDLPKLTGHSAWLRYTVGGWQWTGIFTAQNGAPFTVRAGTDRSLTGLGSDRASFVGNVDPYGGNACGNTAPCVNFLNPAAFTVAPLGQFGNVGKGSLRGPNYINVDSGLFKDIPVKSEAVRFQFRAEFFNVFNRVNYDLPAGDSRTPAYNGANFGSLNRALERERIGQLALKLLF